MLFHLSQREIAVTCYMVDFKEVFLASLTPASQSQALCSWTLGVEFFNNSAPSPRVPDLCLGSAQHPEPSSFLPLPTAAGSFCFCSDAKSKCIFAWASSLPAKFMLLLHVREGVTQGVGFITLCHPQGLFQVSCPAPSLAYRRRPMVKLRSAFLCV